MAVDSDAAIIEAFQDKLDLVVTAIEAEDWPTAYIKLCAAKAIRMKIVNASLNSEGSSLQRADMKFDELVKLIEAGESKAGQREDAGRRMIRTQTAHG